MVANTWDKTLNQQFILHDLRSHSTVTIVTSLLLLNKHVANFTPELLFVFDVSIMCTIDVTSELLRILAGYKEYIISYNFFYFSTFRLLVNKRRNRTAIFSVNGAQKILMEPTPNNFQIETRFWPESFDGDLVGRIQAGSFGKLWASGSTKHDY